MEELAKYDTGNVQYAPETKFEIGQDCVYCLRQTGWYRGGPVLTNDVVISIAAQRLTEQQKTAIAVCIRDALNETFPAKEEYEKDKTDTTGN